jgi:pimeloyl-ACP methyl ester carboxylesterase
MDNSELLYAETYELDPQAEWVVFIHGAGGSVRTFKYQLEAFQQHFNVLLLDLRDHGKSTLPPPGDNEYSLELMARDVMKLLENMGLTSAHFVGVSLGSLVIRWIEFLRPGMVKSIVLAGGVFGLNAKMKILLKLGLAIANLLPFKLLYKLLAWIIMPRKNHSHSRKIFVRESQRIAEETFLNWLEVPRHIGKELEKFFQHAISVPTLSIMGEQDHVFIGPAKAYASRTEGVEMITIPSCGHVCNIENANDFNRAAIDFLKQKAAANRAPAPLPQSESWKLRA